MSVIFWRIIVCEVFKKKVEIFLEISYKLIKGNIRLKALYSFKCLIVYFRISLKFKFGLNKSEKF